MSQIALDKLKSAQTLLPQTKEQDVVDAFLADEVLKRLSDALDTLNQVSQVPGVDTELQNLVKNLLEVKQFIERIGGSIKNKLQDAWDYIHSLLDSVV